MDVDLSRKRIEKNLEELKPYTSTHGNGCTRLPFSKETRDAAEYLKQVMREAGFEVREDSMGNVIGVLPGMDRTLPAIVSGSHYDSVYNGGNYDGIAGVVSAIEIARLLRDNKIKLKRDYIAIAFMDEEGTRFGTGYFGSKGILGQIKVDETKTLTDKDGISIYQAMKNYGLIPEKIPEAKWDKNRLGYFIELHIEQGPVLYSKKLDIGLVTGIVAIERYMVTVNGRADHAGTTPMDMRKDAMEIATKVASKIPDYARQMGEGSVATVGYINAIPGGMNIVAQSVTFSIDIRSMDKNIIKKIFNKIKDSLEEETSKYDANYEIETKMAIDSVEMSAEMLDIMEDSCKKYGYSYLRLPSGAGHDSLAIAQNNPNTVMVFTPSENGRSHSMEEYTSYEYFGKAVSVIYDLILKIGS